MRLDQWLVAKGHVPSRARAVALIESGAVSVNGAGAKASREIVAGDVVEVAEADHGYVGRGALKLKALLDEADAELKGAVVVDVGASTGGFTEVCLERGAVKVYAVDVGRSQLHARLRADARVVVMEGVDARELERSVFEPVPTVMVSDVSFISMTKVLPEVVRVLPELEELFLLVKPQFEVGHGNVGKGGLVKDEGLRLAAVAAVRQCAEDLGFKVGVEMESPIAGGDGNVEYLLYASKTTR